MSVNNIQNKFRKSLAVILGLSIIIINPHLAWAVPPTILSVVPNTGDVNGGSYITITGSNFEVGVIVRIGGTQIASTEMERRSATEILAVVPPGSVGPQNVSVQNPNGESAVLTNGFTYTRIPYLSTISPNNGPQSGGTFVTITGQNFIPGTTVRFGDILASSVTYINSSQLTAITPAASTSQIITVINPDNESSTSSGLFSYIFSPRIDSITPNSGLVGGGTSITISGNFFSPGVVVRIGGALATSITRVNSFTITAVTPPGTVGRADVVVSNSDGQFRTIPRGYTYLNQVSPLMITPNLGRLSGGETIAITGTYFVSTSTVRIGGVLSPRVTFINSNYITARTPPGTEGAQDVEVTTEGNVVVTAEDGYYYNPAPIINSVTPNAGPTSGGTFITINGSHFLPDARVTIGAYEITQVTFVSSSQITGYTFAATAGPRSVRVFNFDRQDHNFDNGFNYIGVNPAPPGPFTTTPDSGSLLGGEVVYINGTFLSPGATVTVDGVAAPNVFYESDQRIGFTTPPGSSEGLKDITVTNPDGQSRTQPNIFYYQIYPPQIVFISPDSRYLISNPIISIFGRNFYPGVTVTIGGINAAVENYAPDSLVVRTPNLSVGTYDVVITNPNGDIVTRPEGFTYNPTPPPGPNSNITPNQGSYMGGTSITITGINFFEGVAVTIGGQPVTNLIYHSENLLTALTPAGSVGARDVVIRNIDDQSRTITGGFTYTGLPVPVVTSVTPNFGPTVGGTDIAINGSNFAANAVVTIGGIAPTNIAITSNRITATTPAATIGPKDVVIVNPDGQSGTLTNGFTYVEISQQGTPLPTGINIFDPSTGGTGEIAYELDQSESVEIIIYDRFGAEVITLLDGTRPAGVHLERWNGRNSSGEVVASGYYNVLLTIGGKTTKLKFVVMK